RGPRRSAVDAEFGEPLLPASSEAGPRKIGWATPGVSAYLGGTFGAQLANNALQVVLPLHLMQLAHSASIVGFATGLTTATDALGALLRGALGARDKPKPLLSGATSVRAGAPTDSAGSDLAG